MAEICSYNGLIINFQEKKITSVAGGKISGAGGWELITGINPGHVFEGRKTINVEILSFSAAKYCFRLVGEKSWEQAVTCGERLRGCCYKSDYKTLLLQLPPLFRRSGTSSPGMNVKGGRFREKCDK